jgi:uncharacterized protein
LNLNDTAEFEPTRETEAMDAVVARPAALSGGSLPPARQKRSRRATFIKWLRKVHGWIGLWGAALGLLFGTTGFLMNHRAGPLHISTGEPQVSTAQVALPQPVPETPLALAQWLRESMRLPGKPGRVQKEPAHRVEWGEQSVVQPEHWQMMFSTPRETTSVEYWVGNSYVTLRHSDNSLLATVENLHKGVGMSIGWVLLVDTLAGSIVLLSLTGVLLWTELNRRKTVGAVLVIGSIVAALCVGMA